MEMAVPGIKKEFCRVSINADGNLEIAIENKLEHKEESKEEHKEHYLRREFNYSNYQQTYELPDDIGGGTLGGNDQVHSGGTAHLSHAADGVLHFLGGGQHQVCQLIDDHHHGGQCLPLLAVFVRLGLLRQSIVGGQILHTVFGEQFVPLHHLKYRPLQFPERHTILPDT